MTTKAQEQIAEMLAFPQAYSKADFMSATRHLQSVVFGLQSDNAKLEQVVAMRHDADVRLGEERAKVAAAIARVAELEAQNASLQNYAATLYVKLYRRREMHRVTRRRVAELERLVAAFVQAVKEIEAADEADAGDWP